MTTTQRNVITVVVAIAGIVVGVYGNAYYSKKSEERIIAALKLELEKLKEARGSQERINELETIIKYKTATI